LLVVGCWEIHQLATFNHLLSSKDGLNNILTGIEPGENKLNAFFSISMNLVILK
jgi:hypothetical protein